MTRTIAEKCALKQHFRSFCKNEGLEQQRFIRTIILHEHISIIHFLETLHIPCLQTIKQIKVVREIKLLKLLIPEAQVIVTNKTNERQGLR